MAHNGHHFPRARWSGQLAFVLAAAASAIGLGNLWRFPYLAAQYGGGTFIVIYLLLTMTLGFTLMVTEISIGRMTAQSPLTAYGRIHHRWGFLGYLAVFIPAVICPYYCVITGWVAKYFITYLKMAITGVNVMGENAIDSGTFFTSFISSTDPLWYGAIVIIACSGVILLGVKNGIERSNLVMMPLLFISAVAICIYVACLPGSGAGLAYYLIPNMDCLTDSAGHFSFALLGKTILGAMGQMFYSLSLAMGIMITYGSYMKKQDNIERSVRNIEVADTFVAIIAGFMIIPVVYMFAVKTGVTPELIAAHGGDVELATKAAVKAAMNQGPGLMFVTLPKVFASIGAGGAWLGAAFFLLVIFAAATSAISLLEACTSSFCDLFHLHRTQSGLLVMVGTLALSVFSSLSYGVFEDVKIMRYPFLDFFDFITNSVLMPIVAVLTCLFIGWAMSPRLVIDQCERTGHTFGAKRFYSLMVRYFAPLLLIAILVSEICRALEVKGWSI